MRQQLEARLLAALSDAGRASSDFDLNPDVVVEENRVLRDAAVLVPVMSLKAGARVILTTRSSQLKHHPGQIAFPGGKLDDSDASLEACALREAQEEMGLPPQKAQLLGRLPRHETVTGFRVTPILGIIEPDFIPQPEIGEVAEVFSVPLDHVTCHKNFAIESRVWRGHRRKYFTVPYGPYYIWGATARILRGLADRLAS